MIEDPAKAKRDGSMPYIMLINLILLLNIFFITSGTIAKQGVASSVNVPGSMNQETSAMADQAIEVMKDGRIFIDNAVIPDEQFVEYIRQYVEKNPDKPVYIKADAALSAPNLFRLMKNVGEAGGAEIRLIAMKQL